ncbi:MAG TPA: response regulator [Roseiflexaceae bacterium]|nr:response regulator [Roseiflexaceae bacterium]HMP39830.1 response regulator [Roseiflexaceae bacterium]
MEPIILVIEDDPDLGRLFEAMLEVEGYRIAVVRNFRAAREWLQHDYPDLIIYDWAPTDAAGYYWLDDIHNSASTMHIPVMLVCGAVPPNRLHELLDTAGIPIVEKPFDLRDFRRHVHALIQPRERAVGA